MLLYKPTLIHGNRGIIKILEGQFTSIWIANFYFFFFCEYGNLVLWLLEPRNKIMTVFCNLLRMYILLVQWISHDIHKN